ncbi:MAG: metallopeptidase family protein [Bowdeniella nasicola]|nr:metallopeptidase family protein [Bowdeniella nasicola]
MDCPPPPLTCSDAEFERLVEQGLMRIPQRLLDLLDNVAILVEDAPPPDIPADTLGLYDGIPLTERDEGWLAGALPDRIYIYQQPLLRMCTSYEELVEEVAITVVHEIAHHFGIDDDALIALGWD